MRFFVVLIMVVLVSGSASGAGPVNATDTKKETKSYIYEWTDAKGNVHITDDLGEVPERYRAKARAVEMPKGREVRPQQQPEQVAPAPETDTQARDAAMKAAWQTRLRDWKKRLANAQKRYRELDKKRLDALGQWGGAASGHLEGRAEAERISKEMENVQKEIDEAKDMVETVIPEEARRAGIPPGWLRE